MRILFAVAVLISLAILAAGEGQDGDGQGVPDMLSRSKCSFESASWSSNFGSKITLKAATSFESGTSISVDDSVVVTLKSTCSVKDAAYASVSFVSTTSSKAKVIMMKGGNDKNGNTLKGNVKASSLKTVGPHLKVIFSVGDKSIQPMKWNAGEISVMDPSGKAPIPEPAPSRHEAMFAAPELLSHTFRPEQEDPPLVIPLLSSAATAAPLVIYCYMLFSKLGFNMSGMKTGGPIGPAVEGLFLLSIAAALGLGVLYWYNLRLVDLLFPLAGLALFMVLIGHQALGRVADARLEGEKTRKGE